jgi:putative membrane protein
MPEQLTVSDQLARDRTVLANERTLLAYLRTALGLLAGGTSLVKLFPQDESLVITGIALLLLGLGLSAVGLVRFFRVRVALRRLVAGRVGTTGGG